MRLDERDKRNVLNKNLWTWGSIYTIYIVFFDGP
jgi:hypothetical protein